MTFASRLSLCGFCTAFLFIAGCTPVPPGDTGGDVGGTIGEETSSAAEASSTSDIDLGGVHVFIRQVRGTACKNFEADISGISSQCVKICDNNERFKEAKELAIKLCDTFCLERHCPKGLFTAPPKCVSAGCYKPSSDCKDPAFPLKNYCGLSESSPDWNCSCPEL